MGPFELRLRMGGKRGQGEHGSGGQSEQKASRMVYHIQNPPEAPALGPDCAFPRAAPLA